MKNSRFALPLALAALMACISEAPAALTAIQTVSFGGGTDSTFTNAADSTRIILNAGTESIAGFTKFDPAFGTLREILITLQIEVSFQITLSAADDALLDPAQEFSFLYAFNSDQNQYLSGFLDYSTLDPDGDSRTGFSVAEVAGSIGPIGGENLNPDDFTDVDGNSGFYYMQTDSVVLSSGTNPVTGSIQADDPGIQIADFVGANGNVQGLQVLGLFQANNTDTAYSIENLNTPGGTFIEPLLDLAPGSVTLQYRYDVVPEPSVMLLAGLLPLALLRRRRVHG